MFIDHYQTNAAAPIQPLCLSECWVRAGKFPFRVLAVTESGIKIGDKTPLNNTYKHTYEVGNIVTILSFNDEYAMTDDNNRALNSEIPRWLLLKD